MRVACGDIIVACGDYVIRMWLSCADHVSYIYNFIIYVLSVVCSNLSQYGKHLYRLSGTAEIWGGSEGVCTNLHPLLK